MYRLGILFSFLLISFTTYAQQSSDPTRDLMPLPSHVGLREGEFIFPSNDFLVGVHLRHHRREIFVPWEGKPEAPLTQYIHWFQRRLAEQMGMLKMTPFPGGSPSLSRQLNIFIERWDSLHLGVDESYTLEVGKDSISLSAATQYGAMRGLETILQLVAFNEKGTHIPSVIIEDRPRFPWRGVLLDVSRHFMPVANVKRTLDGMASVKMNVLHWHLSDDHGWRLELKNSPELTEKASEGQYYTQEQVREIIAYAADRGIRVIPEVDMPGHASAILTAYPHLGSRASQEYEYHLQNTAGVFDPTLDPTREETYARIQIIAKEMASLFPDPVFHIGGDENEGVEWAANPRIQAFMKEHGYKNQHELQAYFNSRLERILTPLGKRMMGWDEILDGDLPQTTIIHAWRSWVKNDQGWQTHTRAAKKEHQVVVSMGYYLDLLLPAIEHYSFDPIPMSQDLTPEEEARILGGEACMWAELVTPLTVDSRLWPRAAAVAERLWSPSHVQNSDDMYRRLAIASTRLESLGLWHVAGPQQILRRMAKGQSIAPLEVLVGLCEPLKNYTRNPGGSYYVMQSPFALFADACTADAPIARDINTRVRQVIDERNKKVSIQLESDLRQWGETVRLTLETKSHVAMYAAYDTELFQLAKVTYSTLTTMAEMLKALREGLPVEELLEKAELQFKLIDDDSYMRTELMIKDSFVALQQALTK